MWVPAVGEGHDMDSRAEISVSCPAPTRSQVVICPVASHLRQLSVHNHKDRVPSSNNVLAFLEYKAIACSSPYLEWCPLQLAAGRWKSKRGKATCNELNAGNINWKSDLTDCSAAAKNPASSFSNPCRNKVSAATDQKCTACKRRSATIQLHGDLWVLKKKAI
jgi:hypothetical protein